MGTTLPPYNWRVPLGTDRPAGHTQMTDLATDIAATVLSHRKVPFALLNFGAAALTPGLGWINLTPSAQVALHGMTVQSNGIKVPNSGRYLAVGMIRFWNLSATGGTVEIGTSGGMLFTGTLAAPVASGSVAQSVAVGVLNLDQTSNPIVLRYNAGGTPQMDYGYLSLYRLTDNT